MLSRDEIYAKIYEAHGGDENQVKAIFSNDNRIMLEAPAGCGKTKTMVSKIAYIIASKNLERNKRILALTFSNSAAFKMRRDVSKELPNIGLKDLNSPESTKKYFSITNYHGFARSVLNKYGYLLNEELRNIENFTIDNESNFSPEKTNITPLSFEEADSLITFEKAVNCCDETYICENIKGYNELLLTKLVPNKFITYNGIISLCLQILGKKWKLRTFYNKYYQWILIDEFQDTNYLCWLLINSLICDETNLFFMGDPLQRIYGFIGAVPDLCNKASSQFLMNTIELNMNYRFRNNPDMLNLDNNIRSFAKSLSDSLKNQSLGSKIEVSKFQVLNTVDSNILFNRYDDTCEESKKIAELISQHLQRIKPTEKIAILVRTTGTNSNLFATGLSYYNIPYFDGTFKDEEKDYYHFERKVKSILNDYQDNSSYLHISKKSLNYIYNELCIYYGVKDNKDGTISDSILENSTNRFKKVETIKSLLLLTKALFRKLFSEYSFISDEEKIQFIFESFTNKTLRQNMDYLDNRVILSTIHGAKGLEWDYVFMPCMNQFDFPGYRALCYTCAYRNEIQKGNEFFCNLTISNDNVNLFLDELSVFYVGITRAKKQIYFSSSKNRMTSQETWSHAKNSCLLSISGINI